MIWLSGPHRGGENDLKIFKDGLIHMIPEGKIAIADSAYNPKEPELKRKVSLPSQTDSVRLHRFKTRARARHESFNGRLKKFSILSGEKWRHGKGAEPGRTYFGIVITAVVIIIQYQMDNGQPLFSLR